MVELDVRDRTVLVTGGAGFIGSNIVDGLLAQGAKVRVLDNLSTGRLQNLAHCAGRIELLQGDIRDKSLCERACRDAVLVFHQAAMVSVPASMRDPDLAMEINVAGTANIMAAACRHGVSRLVYASSSAVYGDCDELPATEGREGRPVSAYGLSKRMDEELGDLYTRCLGLPTVGLRYFNVYGPRQDPASPYAAVIPIFVDAIRANRAPTIFGDGSQSRDFVFIGDVVRANLLAAAAPRNACGAAYNIGAGCRTTVAQLATLVAQCLGSDISPSYAAARQGDIMHSTASTILARDRIGFCVTTSLQEGLTSTVAAA